jgi:hypothetical protein
MRWQTYNRQLEKFDALDSALDSGIFALLAKFEGRK